MKVCAKRGQMQISFGFIVGIIIIGATVGVAVFVINHFLSLSSCSEIGFFLEDFENEVDRAWSSSLYEDTFKESLPGGVEQVCFGNLTQAIEIRYQDIYDELREDNFRDDYRRNVWLVPQHQSCDGDLSSRYVEHAAIEKFFCVDVVDGVAEVRIDKGNFDSLAKVARI